MMKSSKLVFFTTFTIFSLFNINKAEAGMASVPFLPISDVDLHGNPLPSPICPDGWVPTELSNKICKPLGGKEPDLKLPSDSNTTNVSNDITNNANATASSINNNSTVSISNTNTSYFGFANGSKIPATFFNINYINDDGHDVVQAGVSVPLGVKKSTILKDVERANKLEEAKFCLDLIKSGVSMNHSFFDCDGFILPEVELRDSADVAELASIKSEMKEYLSVIKKLKDTNEALRLRLTQIQITNTPVPAKH